MTRGLEAAGHLDFLEHFDLVAGLDVVVALDADTAFHAGPHFGHVVLEAAQGFQFAFEDHHVLAQYADRTVTVNHAFQHHTTGDGTELRRAEHVAHFGDTQDVLPDIAAEHAGQRFLHVFDDVVDHVVITHIQTFLLDYLARAGIGPHVEAEQHRAGRQGQVGIALGDTTDTAADHTHLHFVVAQAAQGAMQGFQRATDVGFEDDIQRLLLFLAHVLEDVFQLAGVSTGQLDLAELALTEQGHFAGLLLVGQHAQLVTRIRGAVQAEDLDRDRRAGFFHRLAVLVEPGADTAEVRTDQDHVALAQGTVLYQYGGNRTATLVQARLDHDATARGRRSGFEFQDLGLQQAGFQQFVDAGTHFRGDRNERCITAPLFRGHAVNRQLAADAIEIGARLVDLVHRDDQRNTGGLGVLNGFDGLRHHAVVRRHHQDHDVGGLGTTGTHGGERRVTRGVEEGHHAAIGFHVVGADVLGDTNRIAFSHFSA